MPRPRRVRSAPRNGLTAGHQLRLTSPVMADMVEVVLREHVLVGTRSSYQSAVNQFTTFVVARGGRPFPVKAVWVAAWILFMAMDISVVSLRGYLSALRYEQGCLGMHWELEGNEVVRRAMRYVSRRYGVAKKSLKFPITLEVLRRIFSMIPGWPNLRQMSHDDRVFAAASAVGVFGFLRGGEFLWSRGSGRPVLSSKNMVIRSLHGIRCIEVSIPHPKARWWLKSESVLCLSPSSVSLLDPVWLVEGMRNLAPWPPAESDPAFRMSDGLPLSKQWMLARTRFLLKKADVHFPDHLGASVDVQAASWRAGGACTAKRAGVSDATICHMGRWASTSFLRYTSAVELQELHVAVERMGVPQGEGALVARVGRAFPAEADEAVPLEISAGVERLVHGLRRAGPYPVGPPAPLFSGARQACG